MNVCKRTGIAVLLVTTALSTVSWAQPVNDYLSENKTTLEEQSVSGEPAEELYKLRSAEERLNSVSGRLAPNSASMALAQQDLNELQKRILDTANSRRQRAMQEYMDINNELNAMEADVRRQTGRTAVSPESLEATVQSLEKENEALMLDEAAARARRDAIEEAIKGLAGKASDAAVNDAASQELQKEVELRMKQLQLLQDQAKQGVVAQADVETAEANLAEARTKLAERRSAIGGEAGGNLSSALNRELLDLGIAEAERQAKLEFVEKRLQTLGQAMQTDLRGAMRKKTLAEAAVYEATRNLRAIQDEIEASNGETIAARNLTTLNVQR